MDKEWYSKHILQIKDKAGARYTPELNIDLPISEIFDGIGRTKNFYTTIREKYGELLREFRYVTSKFEDTELQKAYDVIKKKTESLLKLLEKIKGYNIDPISWDNVQKQTTVLEDSLSEFANQLRTAREQKKDIKVPAKADGSYQPSPSEKFNSDIHYIYKVQKLVYYFEKLSTSTKAQLSNAPFLLLTGSAGTGKTHLLCDIVEQRFKNKIKPLPTFLVFGEYFTDKNNFWKQTLEQLTINSTIKTKESFLKKMDTLGKKERSRTLFIIDALNENITQSPGFWKKNLDSIIQAIKKYPNIALVISIRNGFEKEVLTEKQKKTFIHEEHSGFRFREWEAVNTFFNEFGLSLPEVPLLMPEFQNPLFLLLFCSAFSTKKRDLSKKNRKELQKLKNKKTKFRGTEGATYIFESFVLNATEIVAKKFKISKGIFKSPAYRVWSEVIKEIASEMVKIDTDRITEEKLIEILKKSYPDINSGKLLQVLESDMLIVKVPKYENGERTDGFDIRFPFQKFSDHLIGRYIFKKYENEFGKQNKNLKTAKKYFSKKRKLGKSLSKSCNRGIIEALSIQCPEQLRGIELIEIAPYLRKDQYLSQIANESFVESLIWRSPKAFSADSKNSLKIINRDIMKTESGHNLLLNAFLSVAPIPNHPFNAERLHQHLFKFSMPKRDAWWSTFLHYQYGERGAVDRLIEWSWSNQDYSHISDESIFLTCTALSWFLTTPNRFVVNRK